MSTSPGRGVSGLTEAPSSESHSGWRRWNRTRASAWSLLSSACSSSLVRVGRFWRAVSISETSGAGGGLSTSLSSFLCSCSSAQLPQGYFSGAWISCPESSERDSSESSCQAGSCHLAPGHLASSHPSFQPVLQFHVLVLSHPCHHAESRDEGHLPFGHLALCSDHMLHASVSTRATRAPGRWWPVLEPSCYVGHLILLAPLRAARTRSSKCSVTCCTMVGSRDAA